MKTLPDHPCLPGGVLLVGINPAPVSVAAGHYYQGTHGRRLWKRLAEIGLLNDASPGREDEAFVAAGNGLTDLVKRPTSAAHMLTEGELRAGEAVLRAKVAKWRPGLILFAYKPPAEALLGRRAVAPGRCADLDGTPTFLLSGPYARADLAARINDDLRDLLGAPSGSPTRTWSATSKKPRENPKGRRSLAPTGTARKDNSRTQTVTNTDLANGRIRLPRSAKPIFPITRARVEIMLRGGTVDARYDPKTGPDRERSAVLSLGRDAMRSVSAGEVLTVSVNASGVVCLD